MTGVSRGSETWLDIADWLAWWLQEPRLTPKSQKVLERYYRSYRLHFSHYLRRYYARQTAEVQALVANGTRLLEVGCGCGTESLWFAVLGASVVGVDVNESRLAVARERAGYLRARLSTELDVKFVQASLFDLESPDAFDIVWMEQAFHHLEPRDQVPAFLAELLKPGGHVVVSEANGWNPALQLALLRQRGFRTIKEYTDVHGNAHLYGDERITTAEHLSRRFCQNGFELVAKNYFRVLPNMAVADRLAWVEHLVPQWLLPAYTHYNVVLQKK